MNSGLAACWAAIQSAPDPWAPVWRGLTMPQRRALMTVGGCSPSKSLEYCEWSELPGAAREMIRNGAPAMLRILRRVVPAEVVPE